MREAAVRVVNRRRNQFSQSVSRSRSAFEEVGENGTDRWAGLRHASRPSVRMYLFKAAEKGSNLRQQQHRHAERQSGRRRHQGLRRQPRIAQIPGASGLGRAARAVACAGWTGSLTGRARPACRAGSWTRAPRRVRRTRTAGPRSCCPRWGRWSAQTTAAAGGVGAAV